MRRLTCALIILCACAPVAMADAWVATPVSPGLEATYAPGGTLVAGRLAQGPYLVVGRSRANGGAYLRLAAPWRAGEAWVEQASVTLARMPVRVTVDRMTGVVRVFRGRDVVLRVTAAVGAGIHDVRGAILARGASVRTTAWSRQGEGARIVFGTAPGPAVVSLAPRDLARVRAATRVGAPFVVR